MTDHEIEKQKRGSILKTRILSLLLAAFLLCSVFVLAASAQDDGRTVVVACSDFQNKEGDEKGAALVSKILGNIKNDGYEADGFLCCGDYTVELGRSDQLACSANGLETLKNTVHGIMPGLRYEAYVKGNHDPTINAGNTGLSPSGANDTDEYGVYVIHENEYMWQQRSVTQRRMVIQTANALEAYLTKKVKEGYRKPVFIITHLPLNYSMRTYEDGDAMFASYLYNVIDSAAKKGLNIFYLFGHDHSHGWDNYLGASSIYLEKGDTIYIAGEKGQKTQPNAKKLSFTYMNAGYVGYYTVEDYDEAPVDKTLTMTVFSFGEGEMQIFRYDENGVHDLKSAGYHNGRGSDVGQISEEERVAYYKPDPRVIPSGRTEFLNPFTDVTYKDWYFGAVGYSYLESLFNGTSAVTFSPNASMNRAMLVTVLWRLEGSPEKTASASFTDVKQGTWYDEPVSWAYGCGIVKGTTDTTFAPEGIITREQMAAILYRYSEYKTYNTEKRTDLSAFPDAASVSSYAKEAVRWSVAEGLITGSLSGGKTYILPKDGATRAQVAAILERFVGTVTD